MKPASAPSTTALADDADAQRSVRRIVARHFFGTAAAVALLLALLFAFVPLGIEARARWPLSLCFGALAALALLSMRANVARIQTRVTLSAIVAILAIALAVTLLDWGIAGPGIGFFGLLTCMACAVAGLRVGLLLAALSSAVVLGLAAAQYQAWLPASHAAVSADSLGLRTLVHLLVIGAGLAGGWLVSRVVSRYVTSAELREQRFRGLLGIAADAYWEIDARVPSGDLQPQQGQAAAGMGTGRGLGRVPWELPEFDCDDGHAGPAARRPRRARTLPQPAHAMAGHAWRRCATSCSAASRASTRPRPFVVIGVWRAT